MESAKKNPNVIEINPDVSRRENSSVPIAAFAAQTARMREIEVSPAVVHQLPASEIPDRWKLVSKAQLINKLNYINFQDGTVLINFNHLKYDKTITVKATPQPCVGDLVDCLWSEDKNISQIIQSYAFSNLMITNGRRLLKVEAELVRMDNESISLLLPEECYEISSRKVRRHTCQGINVQLMQNSTVFCGVLMDFNGFSFRVKLTAVPPQTFDWMNPDQPMNIVLSDLSFTYYSGECKVIRYTRGNNTRNYILEPLKKEIQRFRQKEFRSERYELTPSPNLVFQHPFTKARIDLKVVDLSGSGFSVEEDESNTALLPGMILPELELSFAESYKIKCSAQVVFRKSIMAPNGQKWVKCGLALLDMNIQDHLKLISLLHQTKDKNSYICNDVDLDALWDFFFETGFIYPDKYVAIQKNKKQIKETYAKIYTRNPHIARHFIYRDKGTIYGHMAMIRFYESAWMIHHHAARKSAPNKAGLIVLDQIGRMINDSHRLYSLHMDYMICYYRPDNKFPARVFGGAAKSIKDPKGCSLDRFAYFHFRPPAGATFDLPAGWQIVETQPDDLIELADFYDHTSGGLMLDAIDLTPDKLDCDNLGRDYKQAGLTRQRQLYSLKQNGNLKAIFMVNTSDVGLNLSDITNCVKVFVTDSEELNADLLKAAICSVARIAGKNDFPALIYPTALADEQEIAYDKIYNLWVCSLQYSDEYFRYLRRLLRFV
ncbi:MAG: hypothetical protein JSW26_00165 [Desulfobacterales bacterium]|nr:MAG: hypothetical protein JSW26_00165 [Desulfobacterales bacterium]